MSDIKLDNLPVEDKQLLMRIYNSVRKNGCFTDEQIATHLSLPVPVFRAMALRPDSRIRLFIQNGIDDIDSASLACVIAYLDDPTQKQNFEAAKTLLARSDKRRVKQETTHHHIHHQAEETAKLTDEQLTDSLRPQVLQ